MTRQAISELLERVRAATGPDREIDGAIALAMGARVRSRGNGRGREWFEDSHGGVETWARHPPAYTSSLDAIVTLIERELPGWNLDLHSPRMGQVWEAVISERKESRAVCVGHAPTAPLALSAAFLQALSAKLETMDREDK